MRAMFGLPTGAAGDGMAGRGPVAAGPTICGQESLLLFRRPGVRWSNDVFQRLDCLAGAVLGSYRLAEVSRRRLVAPLGQ